MKREHMLMLGALMALPALGGVNTDRLHISDLAVLRSDNNLTVNMRVDPKHYDVKSGQKVVLTPAVIAGADTLLLDPVTVAGRRAWFYEVRNDRDNPLLARSGSSEPVDYSRTVDYEPWMDVSRVEILVDTRNECHCKAGTESVAFETVPVARIDERRSFQAENFPYVVPSDTIEKLFTLSGRADIRFMVGKTGIDWSYAGNHAELDSILASINAVRDNRDASVREIHLTGYASPEGSYAGNVRLAKGRTEAVKDYVMRHSSFPASVYRTSSVPEDWAGLKTWLERNRIDGYAEMVAFIDDPNVPVETKNDQFARRFPKAYPGLLKEVYPTLRHTDYRITYNIRKYYDVEEIKEVMRTHPRNLSQNELYLVANSYPKNSKEYFETFTLAARLFPNDATANLNAANAAMGFGDLEAAEMYVARAGDSPKAVYARGLLAALRKDYAAARPLLEQAAAAGVEGAREALDEIARAEHSEATGGVTIL